MRFLCDLDYFRSKGWIIVMLCVLSRNAGSVRRPLAMRLTMVHMFSKKSTLEILYCW
jgi:hypothetical protein